MLAWATGDDTEAALSGGRGNAMPEVRLVTMECSHRAEVRIGMKEMLAGGNGCDGPVPFCDCERFG